jgi:DNA ligase (NAD+)
MFIKLRKVIFMIIPTECPTCQSTLERVKDQLFCRNSSCPAQNSKIVESFCKKMKIKGFGEKTIAKLELSSISEIYSLTFEEASAAVGDKVAEKLIAEIDAKRTVDFGEYLGALGIPLIGSVAGKKVGQLANDWVSALEKAADVLGSKANESLINWADSDAGYNLIVDSPVTFIELRSQPVSTGTNKASGTVVITGKLNDFKNRGEAATYLESLGFSVKGSLSSKTNYLIVEDGSTSSKTTKANDLGIPILTIKQLVETIDT